jgi:hypothetical protein
MTRQGQRFVLLLSVLLLISALPARAKSQAPVCYNALDQRTYPQGFRSSDFQTATQAIVGGNVQLHVGAQALDLDAFARALMNHVTTARHRAVQTGRTYVLDLRPNSVAFCQQDPANPGQRTCPSPAGLEASRRFNAKQSRIETGSSEEAGNQTRNRIPSVELGADPSSASLLDHALRDPV